MYCVLISEVDAHLTGRRVFTILSIFHCPWSGIQNSSVKRFFNFFKFQCGVLVFILLEIGFSSSKLLFKRTTNNLYTEEVIMWPRTTSKSNLRPKSSKSLDMLNLKNELSFCFVSWRSSPALQFKLYLATLLLRDIWYLERRNCSFFFYH